MKNKSGKEIKENFALGMITLAWIALIVILIMMSE